MSINNFNNYYFSFVFSINIDTTIPYTIFLDNIISLIFIFFSNSFLYLVMFAHKNYSALDFLTMATISPSRASRSQISVSPCNSFNVFTIPSGIVARRLGELGLIWKALVSIIVFTTIQFVIALWVALFIYCPMKHPTRWATLKYNPTHRAIDKCKGV